MVVDEEPVADVAAVAVDGQRLAGEGVQDHQRDQLLGKLKPSIIVRAIRGQRRQPVSVVVRADQMIGTGFGSRIWAIR